LDKKKLLEEMFENPSYKLVNKSYKEGMENHSRQSKAFFAIATTINLIFSYNSSLNYLQNQVLGEKNVGDFNTDEILKSIPDQIIIEHGSTIPITMEDFLKKFIKE
jgi:hypothetical protein